MKYYYKKSEHDFAYYFNHLNSQYYNIFQLNNQNFVKLSLFANSI